MKQNVNILYLQFYIYLLTLYVRTNNAVFNIDILDAVGNRSKMKKQSCHFDYMNT